MRLGTGLLLVFITAAATVAAEPEPRERTWFEQVERDRDRGAGRVVDDATWETRRIEERRDVRLGRAKPRRAFERFDEERDRELQVETNARRPDRPKAPGIGATGSAILNRPALAGDSAGLATLAAVAAKDSRDLAEAKETLERSLRAVDAAEARELRLLRRRLTREGKPDQFEAQRQSIEQRFDQLRALHQQAYDKVSRRIRGAAPPANKP